MGGASQIFSHKFPTNRKFNHIFPQIFQIPKCEVFVLYISHISLIYPKLSFKLLRFWSNLATIVFPAPATRCDAWALPLPQHHGHRRHRVPRHRRPGKTIQKIHPRKLRWHGENQPSEDVSPIKQNCDFPASHSFVYSGRAMDPNNIETPFRFANTWVVSTQK